MHAGSTKGLVSLLEPEYSRDDVALTTADAVTAVVELRATSSTAVREGLDLVAVLDVSGSMEYKMDSMKKAMQFVIMKLTPVDRLSIVTFSNSATRHCPLRSMTEAAQKDLKAIVDGLAAHGGTNIKSGLETGLAVIDGRVNTKARTANIFLMSDGQQTANDAREVDPHNVGVYTFGFGSKTDHQLLTDIAKKSPGGTFSTVPEGSNLSKPFSQLLGGLLTVVAQDVQLTLTPSAGAGGELDKMVVGPGTDYTQNVDGSTGVITVQFGTLFAGEVRKVTVDLTLLPSSVTAPFDPVLAEAQHRYSAQGKPPSRQAPEDIKIRRTTNPTEYASSKARSVQAEIARRQHADSIGTARVLADDKKLDDARRNLEEAQKALDGIRVDGGQNLVGMLRAELQQLLALMASQELYEAQGRAYALAAETSHGRQRFCDRGDDTDAVRLFATPRMDAYLEQVKQFEKDPTKPLPSAADDVKKELADNPLAAVSTQLAFYLRNAIQALQAIEKIIVAPSPAA